MTAEADYSDRFKIGVKVVKSLGGDPEQLKRWSSLDPVVGPKLDRMLGEFCFGDVWAGDGLDLRTRRVITLTTIAVLGRPSLLKAHVRGALDQGFERAEILEIFVHLIAYAGFPVALSSIEWALEVFAEIDAGEG